MKITEEYQQHLDACIDVTSANQGVEKRLLFADDDRNILEGYRFIFESEGFRVDTAETAEALLKLVSMNTYDMIILDYNMGKERGVDIADRILRINKDVDMIFISGLRYAEEELREKNIPFSGFLEKPLRPDDLLDFLFRHLRMD